MSVRSFTPSKEIVSPRGMWSALAQRRKGNPERASFMQNARISPGVVASRPGTSAILAAAASGIVTGLYNWVAPSGSNYVTYRDGTAIKAFLQQTSSILTLLSTIGSTLRPSFADLDIWLYFTGYDTLGAGTLQARIFDGTNVDKAFRGPITLTAVVPAIGDAGQCSAGTHFLGFVYQNRTGFSGVPTTSIAIPTAPASSTYPTLTVPTFTATQPLGTGLIVGSLDTPNGITVYRSVDFAGWINCSSNKVVGCLLYIDGHYCGQSTYGYLRNDAAQNNPSSDNPYIGFNFGFDVSSLAAGRHSWYQVAILDDGRTLQFPPNNFNVSPGGAVPISITLGSDGLQIDVSVTLPPLTDGGGNAALFLILTRADNPDLWYFMPTDSQTGAIGEQPVPFNTAATLNFVANLSDGDMADSLAGDTASEQFLLLVQDGSGNGPFAPSFVVVYGQRMCYGVGSSLYVSNINDPQHVTGDQHVVTMPNKRVIAYAFPLPGSTDLYLTGDRWTSRVTDNSDVPATWAQPILVSEALGAPFPACVCYRTRGDYAWVVTEAGIYVFSGTYADRPVTYLCSDQWQRVNWAAAYAIETADDVVGLRFYAAVPLDGATTPSHLFCIDYTNGLTYDQVDISLDNFAQPFSSIAIVKELQIADPACTSSSYATETLASSSMTNNTGDGQTHTAIIDVELTVASVLGLTGFGGDGSLFGPGVPGGNTASQDLAGATLTSIDFTFSSIVYGSGQNPGPLPGPSTATINVVIDDGYGVTHNYSVSLSGNQGDQPTQTLTLNLPICTDEPNYPGPGES